MALGTWFAQGGAVCFALGATQHESQIMGVREIYSSSGGQEFTTADGVVHKQPTVKTITGLEVRCVQDLTAAALWRYLRENSSTSGTIKITGTSSTTEGSSNPEWVYTTTGWEEPPLEFSGSGSNDFPTAVFNVSARTVDVTP